MHSSSLNNSTEGSLKYHTLSVYFPFVKYNREKMLIHSKNTLSLSLGEKINFLTFPACFSIPKIFSNLNSNCSNLLALRNLQELVKKAFCYQNCSDLLWEKIVLMIEKNFEITVTIHSNSEKSEQFLITECFFNLFLEVSQTW